jgi:serine/threonine-protein kinase
VASLNHANIVNVFDVGHEGDIKYIVMEYVHGKTLKELIQEQAPFSNEVMLGVAEQITAALIHAHEGGIIHKDIKPQNILVMPNGSVKVADFGIADDKKSTRKVVEEGSTMGSVHYISPEAACNDPVDARSDLYSLGITMFEMMTGELPFDSDDPDEIPALHIGAPFPNIIKKNPEILPLVREIIAKLTRKDTNKRYQSANLLYKDIKRAIMECAKYRQFETAQQTSRDSAHHTGSVGTPRAVHRDDDISRPAPRPRPPAGRPKKTAADIRRERLFIAGGIGAAALVIVLLVIGINWISGLFGNDDEGYVTVPALIGRDIEWVMQELTAIGIDFIELEPEYSTEAPHIPYGHVLSSNVHGAGDWPLDTPIQLIMSLGPQGAVATISVPDITGLHIDQARAIIENLPIYFAEESSAFNQVVPENHIISQNPQSGTNVPEGTTIYVIWSLGAQAQLATVPNIVALPEAQARSAILNANLAVGNIIVEQSDIIPRGSVIRQITAPGTQLPPGSAIDFVISDGVLPPEPGTEPPTEPYTEPPTEPGENGYENGYDNGYDDPYGENGYDDPEPQPPVETSRVLPLNPLIAAEETVALRLYRIVNGGMRQLVATTEATAEDLPWNVTVSGSGTVEFILSVNGTELSEMVDFD